MWRKVRRSPKVKKAIRSTDAERSEGHADSFSVGDLLAEREVAKSFLVFSMALRSLRYKANSETLPTEKAPVFSGKPHEFYEWEWRTTIYAGSIEKGKEHKILHEITKSLSGDALQTLSLIHI